MASDDIVPVFPEDIIEGGESGLMAGGESPLIMKDDLTATASMRETASNIRNYPTVMPPPAGGKLSLLALTPGLEKAGLSPQAMPASWTSLRVLALAGLVLKQRQWLEQYQRQKKVKEFQAAEHARQNDYNILIEVIKLINEELGIFNKAMM